MRACEHRLRVFLAGSSNGDHSPLCRTDVASVVALAQGVTVCKALNLSSERYYDAGHECCCCGAITLATACV